jgi:8-oxo-dGTP pyrophosphatase MutT (NUDIX family)
VKGQFDAGPGSGGRVPQAGVVAFRTDGGEPRYLLVRARKDPRQWIFPKGHVESGELPRAAALREAREEAGVEGEIESPLGSLEFSSGDEPVRVEYFLVRFLRETPSAEGRETRWCEFGEALALLPFDDARALLQQARSRVECGEL